MICEYFTPDGDKITFSLEKAILWIKDMYFSWKQWFKVKSNDVFVYYRQRFHSMFTNELESCELLVDYCDVFISCLDSHSDGTHSPHLLVSKCCNANFLKICYDEETDSSTFWMA